MLLPTRLRPGLSEGGWGRAGSLALREVGPHCCRVAGQLARRWQMPGTMLGKPQPRSAPLTCLQKAVLRHLRLKCVWHTYPVSGSWGNSDCHSPG